MTVEDIKQEAIRELYNEFDFFECSAISPMTLEQWLRTTFDRIAAAAYKQARGEPNETTYQAGRKAMRKEILELFPTTHFNSMPLTVTVKDVRDAIEACNKINETNT